MEVLSQTYSLIRSLPMAVPTWVWILLSMLFAGSMVYLAIRRNWFGPKIRTEKPIPPAAEAAAEGDEQKAEPTAERKKERPRPGFFARMRQRRRFSRVFKVLLRLLKIEVRGRDFRYQIPWVLLMGEEGAGKSALLPHIQLNKPFGIPELGAAGCDPWLFEKGVVLDLAGRYVTDAEGGADEAGWLAFLRALRSSRPRKPLEGIVLTIAAGELLAFPNAADAVAAKAERVNQQLWTLQKELGLRLPIYLLVTQCDRIEGFGAFSAAIPERTHNDIFGWSNPNSLDAAYHSGDAERAFNAIYRDINDLQLQLVATRGAIEDRDAFLIFPHRFRPLFRHLQTYLDSVFQPSVYHESYYLRGIYFCGDSLAEKTAAAHQALATSDELDFEPKLADGGRNRNILFLTHLFRDKIFAESAIARPVTRSFLWELRRLRILQAAFFTILVLLVAGQWNAYRYLSKVKDDELLPVFNQYEEDTRQINTIRRELGTSFRAQAVALRETKLESMQNLLRGMEHIKARTFSSFFLPPSWISPADQKIRSALASAYASTVLDPMNVGLHFKMRVLLFKSIEERPRSSYHLITEAPAYTGLGAILDGLGELDFHAEQYNSLEDPHDIAQGFDTVQSVARYISGTTMSSQIVPHKNSLAGQALDEVRNFKPFRLDELYMEQARKRVSVLTADWLDGLFGRNALLQQVTKVTEDLNGLRVGGEDPDHLLNALSGLQTELASIDNKLKRPEWNWVAETELSAIPDFQRFFAKVATTPLLGKDYSAKLYETAQERFEAFQQRLLGLRSNLGGSVLQFGQTRASAPAGAESNRLLTLAQQAAAPARANLNANIPAKLGGTANGPQISAAEVGARAEPETAGATADQELMAQAQTGGGTVEAGVTGLSMRGKNLAEDVLGGESQTLGLNSMPVKIKADLADLMAQDFMKNLPFNALQVNLPAGGVVRWKIPPLRRAVELAESYRGFMTERLPDMAPQVQDTVINAGEVRLRHNLQSLIGEAQEIKPALTQRGRAEARLKEGVLNFSEAMPLLKRLADTLESMPRNSNLVQTLRQLSVVEGSRLLELADQLLHTEQLFTPPAGAFQAWEGVTPLSRAVYGVADQEELEYYLSVQRARLEYLVQHYAAPVLEFLDARQGYAGEGYRLVPKWRGIQRELQNYQSKQPNSSLARLEQFILFELDKIQLGNCFTDLKQGRLHAKRDYFMQQLDSLQRRVFDQCAVLAGDNAARDYRIIESAFSDQLAGRFPFAPVTRIDPENGRSEEANLPGLREFFGLLQDYQEDLLGVLPHTRRFGGERDLTLAFLRGLDDAQGFLKQTLGPKPETEIPAYAFTFAFRVNRDQEIGANQIIDWELEVANKKVKKVDGVWSGQWVFGDPIKLSMRWARNSPFRPYWDGGANTAVLSLEGESTAVFEFNSQWALLEMFARQRAQVDDTPSRERPDPGLLKFEIPVLELLPAVEKGTVVLAEGGDEEGAQASELDPSIPLPQPAPDAAELILYQGRYHELFTTPEVAVVFARMNLFRSTDQEPVTVPWHFPAKAPQLERRDPGADEGEIPPGWQMPTQAYRAGGPRPAGPMTPMPPEAESDGPAKNQGSAEDAAPLADSPNAAGAKN